MSYENQQSEGANLLSRDSIRQSVYGDMGQNNNTNSNQEGVQQNEFNEQNGSSSQAQARAPDIAGGEEYPGRENATVLSHERYEQIARNPPQDASTQHFIPTSPGGPGGAGQHQSQSQFQEQGLENGNGNGNNDDPQEKPQARYLQEDDRQPSRSYAASMREQAPATQGNFAGVGSGAAGGYPQEKGTQQYQQPQQQEQYRNTQQQQPVRAEFVDLHPEQHQQQQQPEQDSHLSQPAFAQGRALSSFNPNQPQQQQQQQYAPPQAQFASSTPQHLSQQPIYEEGQSVSRQPSAAGTNATGLNAIAVGTVNGSGNDRETLNREPSIARQSYINTAAPAERQASPVMNGTHQKGYSANGQPDVRYLSSGTSAAAAPVAGGGLGAAIATSGHGIMRSDKKALKSEIKTEKTFEKDLAVQAKSEAKDIDQAIRMSKMSAKAAEKSGKHTLSYRKTYDKAIKAEVKMKEKLLAITTEYNKVAAELEKATKEMQIRQNQQKADQETREADARKVDELRKMKGVHDMEREAKHGESITKQAQAKRALSTKRPKSTAF